MLLILNEINIKITPNVSGFLFVKILIIYTLDINWPEVMTTLL